MRKVSGTDYKVGYGKPPVEYQVKPGQVLNPRGRPAAGAAVKEYLNVMQDWPLADVQAVLADPNASAAKVAAARVWMDACTADRNSAGMPVAGGDFDRVMDQTVGKPKAAVDLTTNGESLYLKSTRGVSQDDL